MKVIIKKIDLLGHEKILKRVNPHKKAILTLNVSNNFSVTGPGFSQNIDCNTVEQGAVSIPYLAWKQLLKNLIPRSGNEIILEATSGQIKFNNLIISNPEIIDTPPDNSPLEFAINAKSVDVIKYLMTHGADKLKKAGMFGVADEALAHLRDRLETASEILKEYSVSSKDLFLLVAQKIGIDDWQAFSKILFKDGNISKRE